MTDPTCTCWYGPDSEPAKFTDDPRCPQHKDLPQRCECNTYEWGDVNENPDLCDCGHPVDDHFDGDPRYCMVPEASPTPPPLTVDRATIANVLHRAINACLCNADIPGWTIAEEAHKAADAVVAELAAGRAVVDLNTAKAQALRAEAQWFRDGADSPTAGASGKAVALAVAGQIDIHADALDGGRTD